MPKLGKKEEPNIVWSDEAGFDRKQKKTKNSSQKEVRPTEMTLEIKREKKGRGGKEVCVIYAIEPGHDYFKNLTKKLKRHCGSGGTFKGDSIEVQGDHRDKIRAFLEELGFKVKFTGG